MPLLAFWCALLVGAAALGVLVQSAATRRAKLAVAAAMAFAVTALAMTRPRAAPAMAGAPKTQAADGYSGSAACAACHPGEHASWARTFHRTMTQRASAATVLAPLETPFAAEGVLYTLSSDRDGSVWVRVGAEARQRVLLTTGSHHMQGYWVASSPSPSPAAPSGALRMLPFVFARDEAKTIARRDAFIQPPDATQSDVRWNANCIQCHATAGRPGADTTAGRDGTVATYRTEVGDLGIACEACHGPGAAHVAHYHDPLARWAGRRRYGGANAAADPTIVNPAKLSAERAAAVCGQCHAYAYPKDEEAFWRSGYVERFRPGDALEASRTLLSPAVLADPAGPALDVPGSRAGDESEATRDLFWPDGTVRVAGREYNAMVQSACYLRGVGARKLSCLSCHAMHDSDPDDQLRRDRSMQTTCISCHAMPADHSRHVAGSPGDACVACHMPKTSYALRTAIRSHRIDVPDSRGAGGEGRPNACNLCHLDRSLAWTVQTLMRWQTGVDAAPELPMPDVPESAMGLLTKDAAERVLWADAMGDADAIAASSGGAWEEPLLKFAADHDPYAVVRFVAVRSLRAVRGAKAVPTKPAPATATATTPPTAMSPKDIAALVLIRDNRDITVAE